MSEITSPRKRASRAAESEVGVDEFVSALLTASRVLMGISARSLADVEETVTVPQFRMLVVLESRGQTNLSALADMLDVNASAALRMVQRLVAAGLVLSSGNPANRREVNIRLTRAGSQLVARVTRRRRIALTKIVSEMLPSERAQFLSALNAFAEAAGEPAPKPPNDAVDW